MLVRIFERIQVKRSEDSTGLSRDRTTLASCEENHSGVRSHVNWLGVALLVGVI